MTHYPFLNLRHLIFTASLSGLLLQVASADPVAVSAVAQPSLQAQSVFEAVRPSVLKVSTLPLGSDQPYSYGSGFAVGTENLIITNYHVVSSVVLDPKHYRLEFLRQDGSKGALAIVAIDVVHDLAIVRGDTGAMIGLDLDQQVPDKGTRGFSIGFPQNLGITVTEGIVNGLSESSVRGAIHYSGPVNSGMSGGPAVNATGRVFGVNVSTLRDSQMISFVVPASAVTALVERTQKTNLPSATELFNDLSQQLQLSSADILDSFPKGNLPVQQLGRFQVPAKPGDFARCYATDQMDAGKVYGIESYGCSFKDYTYVANDLYVGNWNFSFQHVKDVEIGAFRFASLEESLLKRVEDTSTVNKNNKTRWECQDRIVALTGMKAKAVLCLRRYKRFNALYDIEFKLATLANPSDALVSTFSFSGFGYSESMELIRRFVEAIIWKP